MWMKIITGRKHPAYAVPQEQWELHGRWGQLRAVTEISGIQPGHASPDLLDLK
jgi:hypothetical protein